MTAALVLSTCTCFGWVASNEYATPDQWRGLMRRLSTLAKDVGAPAPRLSMYGDILHSVQNDYVTRVTIDLGTAKMPFATSLNPFVAEYLDPVVTMTYTNDGGVTNITFTNYVALTSEYHVGGDDWWWEPTNYPYGPQFATNGVWTNSDPRLASFDNLPDTLVVNPSRDTLMDVDDAMLALAPYFVDVNQMREVTGASSNAPFDQTLIDNYFKAKIVTNWWWEPTARVVVSNNVVNTNFQWVSRAMYATNAPILTTSNAFKWAGIPAYSVLVSIETNIVERYGWQIGINTLYSTNIPVVTTNYRHQYAFPGTPTQRPWKIRLGTIKIVATNSETIIQTNAQTHAVETVIVYYPGSEKSFANYATYADSAYQHIPEHDYIIPPPGYVDFLPGDLSSVTNAYEATASPRGNFPQFDVAPIGIAAFTNEGSATLREEGAEGSYWDTADFNFSASNHFDRIEASREIGDGFGFFWRLTDFSLDNEHYSVERWTNGIAPPDSVIGAQLDFVLTGANFATQPTPGTRFGDYTKQDYEYRKAILDQMSVSYSLSRYDATLDNGLPGIEYVWRGWVPWSRGKLNYGVNAHYSDYYYYWGYSYDDLYDIPFSDPLGRVPSAYTNDVAITGRYDLIWTRDGSGHRASTFTTSPGWDKPSKSAWWNVSDLVEWPDVIDVSVAAMRTPLATADVFYVASVGQRGQKPYFIDPPFAGTTNEYPEFCVEVWDDDGNVVVGMACATTGTITIAAGDAFGKDVLPPIRVYASAELKHTNRITMAGVNLHGGVTPSPNDGEVFSMSPVSYTDTNYAPTITMTTVQRTDTRKTNRQIRDAAVYFKWK